MEAGKAVVVDGVAHAPTDLITAISASAVAAGRRRRAHARRALRLPDLRVVLRHVHRQLDELPHRGARAGPAGQRVDAGHARRPPRAVPGGRAHRHGPVPALVRRTTTRPRCPATSRRGRRSRTRWRSTSPWAARRTPCCTSWPRRRRARSTSTSPTSTRSRRRVPCLSKVAPNCDYHMEDVHRAGGIPAILGELWRGGLLNDGVHTVHSPSLEAWLRRVGRPRPPAPSATARRTVPRRAGRRAHHRGVLDREPLVVARHRRRGAAASATSRTPTPSTAAWPCCAATSPRTARSSRPRASPRSCGTSRARRGSSRARRRPCRGHPQQEGPARRRDRGPLRGPVRRAGDAGDAAPDGVPQGRGAGQGVRADHRRPVLRRLVGHLGRPHLPRGRGRRRDRPRSRTATRSSSTSHPRLLDLRRRRRRAGRAPREDGGRRSGRGSRATATAPVSKALRAYAALATSAHTGAVRRVP